MYRLLGLLFSVKVKKRKSGCMLIAVVTIRNGLAIIRNVATLLLIILSVETS
nr:MAG TPA: hypothetical protein [Bacteriophage sp.]DAO38593.1 MAG TPA: hypothetical protein [Caudoviricetes sp.]